MARAYSIHIITHYDKYDQQERIVAAFTVKKEAKNFINNKLDQRYLKEYDIMTLEDGTDRIIHYGEGVDKWIKRF